MKQKSKIHGKELKTLEELTKDYAKIFLNSRFGRPLSAKDKVIEDFIINHNFTLVSSCLLWKDFFNGEKILRVWYKGARTLKAFEYQWNIEKEGK